MNKQAERRHLDLLLAALPELPRGQVEACEKPDFVMLAAGTRIGIEHTALFHYGPRTHARELAERKVVDDAQRRAQLDECPPLLVFVAFAEAAHLSKQNMSGLSRWLAATILRNLPAIGATHAIGESGQATPLLPSDITQIHVARPISLRNGNWQPSSGGHAPYDFRETLQRELDAKRLKLPTYLESCDECWLLVVATGEVPSSFVSRDGDTRCAHFDFAFKRAFFLDALREQAFELNGRFEAT
jgi:hypothetical protein